MKIIKKKGLCRRKGCKNGARLNIGGDNIIETQEFRWLVVKERHIERVQETSNKEQRAGISFPKRICGARMPIIGRIGTAEKKTVEGFDMCYYSRMLKAICSYNKDTNADILKNAVEKRKLWKSTMKRRDQPVGLVIRNDGL